MDTSATWILIWTRATGTPTFCRKYMGVVSSWMRVLTCVISLCMCVDGPGTAATRFQSTCYRDLWGSA